MRLGGSGIRLLRRLSIITTATLLVLAILSGLALAGYPNTSFPNLLRVERSGPETLLIVERAGDTTYFNVQLTLIVYTLPVTSMTATMATFNGEIRALSGFTITKVGFDWGHTQTATWAQRETGTFGIGTFSIDITNLESDEIYYVRAWVQDSESRKYGAWYGFISGQPDYALQDEPEEGLADIVGAIPGDPGFVMPEDPTFDTNIPGVGLVNRLIGTTDLPVSFFWYVLMMVGTVVVGLLAFAGSKHTLPVFVVGSVSFGFFASLGWIDWWMLLVYIFVGLTILRLESRSMAAGGL